MEVLYQLSYRGIFSSWGREDSNLRRLSRQVYSLLPLAARAHPRVRLPECPDMVANATDFSTSSREPEKGFEPPTCRLQGGCSAPELLERPDYLGREPLRHLGPKRDVGGATESRKLSEERLELARGGAG